MSRKKQNQKLNLHNLLTGNGLTFFFSMMHFHMSKPVYCLSRFAMCIGAPHLTMKLHCAIFQGHFTYSFCRNIFPPNLVQAAIQQYQTVLQPPENSTNTDISDWKITGQYTDGESSLKLRKVIIVYWIDSTLARNEHYGPRRCFDRLRYCYLVSSCTVA